MSTMFSLLLFVERPASASAASSAYKRTGLGVVAVRRSEASTLDFSPLSK